MSCRQMRKWAPAISARLFMEWRGIAALGLAISGGLGLMACRAQRSDKPSVEADAIVAALQSLPLDSICGSECSVVQLDSVIRASRALLAYYPSGLPAALQLRAASTALELGGRTLQVVGRWSVPDSIADTLRLAAYLVEGADSSARTDQLLVGVAMLPPGSVLRTWGVLTTRSPGGWSVTRRWLSFEP